MKLAIATVDVDGELELELVETTDVMATLLKLARDRLGLDNADFEETENAEDVVAVIEEEGYKVEYLIVA